MQEATRSRSRRRLRRTSLRVVGILAALSACIAIPASASAQFQLALQDPGFSSPGTSSAQVATGVYSAIHASTVRLSVGWGSVAPGGSTRAGRLCPCQSG